MKKAAVLHTILFILEIVAFIHDIRAFGMSMFKYYTIDSNLLQMIVSGMIVYCVVFAKKDRIPRYLSILHLICAVCLTITFLIALLVLAPQEGFAYYFLENVAPINHFLGPLISVITFLFMERSGELPKRALFAPLSATLLYGVVALILNALRVLDGPYFFLKVYDTPVGTIIMWFAIISVLCIVLSGLYLWIKNRIQRKKETEV